MRRRARCAGARSRRRPPPGRGGRRGRGRRPWSAEWKEPLPSMPRSRMFWTSRVAWLPSTPSSCGPASACSRAPRTSLTACPVRLPPMPRNPRRPPRTVVGGPCGHLVVSSSCHVTGAFRPGVTSGDGPHAYAARHDPRRRRGARRHASRPRASACAALLHDGRCRTGPLAEVVEAARRLEADRSPRWVWWSAEAGGRPPRGCRGAGRAGLGRRRGPPAPARRVERDRRPVLGGGTRHPGRGGARSPDR